MIHTVPWRSCTLADNHSDSDSSMKARSDSLDVLVIAALE
jgi:hypothetical protein